VTDGKLERSAALEVEQGPLVIGRYVLLGMIASGGMAKVHYGRLLGSAGFSRVVAIKRLHANLASDPDFVAMFVDEARLASRVRHPNVVQTLDVVTIDQEILLVLDYVEGEVLSRLLRPLREIAQTVPLPVASAIVSGTLRGLHAAREAKDEEGRRRLR
jgi:serine/threonine-protein kinase